MADQRLSDQDHADSVAQATNELNAAIGNAAKAGIEVEVSTRDISRVGSVQRDLIECRSRKVLHSQN